MARTPQAVEDQIALLRKQIEIAKSKHMVRSSFETCVANSGAIVVCCCCGSQPSFIDCSLTNTMHNLTLLKDDKTYDALKGMFQVSDIRCAALAVRCRIVALFGV